MPWPSNEETYLVMSDFNFLQLSPQPPEEPTIPENEVFNEAEEIKAAQKDSGDIMQVTGAFVPIEQNIRQIEASKILSSFKAFLNQSQNSYLPVSFKGPFPLRACNGAFFVCSIDFFFPRLSAKRSKKINERNKEYSNLHS